MENFKYFKWSFFFTLVGVGIGFAVGGVSAAVIVAILGVLEVSLSFDNAIINAKKLKDMDAVWRQRYLVWGMAISVGFMRLLFPLVIVSILAKIAPWGAATLAFANPHEYARILQSAHHEVSAFGGSFLMMVFLKFFVDQHKDEHWFHALEGPLTRLGKLESMEIVITLGILVASASFMASAKEQVELLFAGVAGIVTYLLVGSLSALLGEDEADSSKNVTVAKSGLASFLYLEVQDASFSFDGVIGAFALSNNLIIITLGLAIGALFVRSFTLMLVEKGTLSAYRYLEHGAFWAVGSLAVLMFASVHLHIPEVVTGLIGAGLIAAALYSSIRANRQGEAPTA